MTVITPEDIRPHDLLRFTVVGRALDLTDQGAVREQTTIELLHRPKPKPKPYGGILTGKQVKATPWKRGTRFLAVRSGEFPPGASLALDKNAWFSYQITPTHTKAASISSLSDDDLFVLIYRPEEESDRC